MATVNFLFRSVKEEAFLSLRLLFRAEEKDLVFAAKTNLKVSKYYWKRIHKLKRPKDVDIINKQFEINKELTKLESYILNAFHSANASLIDKNWLVQQLDFYYNPNQAVKLIPKGLANYIDYYIKARAEEIKPASVTKFNVIKNKILRLENNINKHILVKEVDENFKKTFIKFCASEKYAHNTIQRELGLIKTFCKHARTSGLEVSTQLDNLKLKKEKISHIYLSFDELEEIEKAELEFEHLENARDWLIISCFLGQRISDFMKFKKSMIRIENGKKLIEFTQQKTEKLMTVPLHPKVLDILKKLGGEFPRRISYQRYNDYIKIVCAKAELNEKVEGKKQVNIAPKDSDKKIIRNIKGVYEKWELVTSHIGRRSFATNFYGKIPTSYLIYITGHSTEAMFLQYIGKSNKDIAMELTNYF
ncbi:tyrosine-type recombinase/integrase [Algibacter mikhailovii]|uniref:tyrosine-type recombinase/integrase n=1 Tax=Algibacter mikhailovii TaxID=425498 RepID=UPI00249568B2|nr:phage integrase SAM-like domain-containing protein [Algibacter mikhailovii]